VLSAHGAGESRLGDRGPPEEHQGLPQVLEDPTQPSRIDGVLAGLR
jgi:hypothetical protein